MYHLVHLQVIQKLIPPESFFLAFTASNLKAFQITFMTTYH